MSKVSEIRVCYAYEHPWICYANELLITSADDIPAKLAFLAIINASYLN